ncbi:hypothetical protein KJ972_04675, partial [Candidatus Micrarchaeota archaeon]|nr:hypothetical protein [Candidatus Micrarchaeota archaeon]
MAQRRRGKQSLKLPSRVVRQTPGKKKRGYSATQWLAIFVVAVIAFSTIAFSLLGSFGDQPPSEEPPAPQDATTFSFQAEVEVTVSEVLPHFKLIAETSQTNIDLLDAMVRSTPGVLQMQSIFRQDPTRGNFLLYEADIMYEKEQFSLNEILEAVLANTQGQLSQTGVFSSALFEVPHNVTFRNEELDLTKEHLFLDQLVQGLVEAPTLKGDRITVHLAATFTGVSLVELTAFEVLNPETQITERVASRIMKVDSLEPVLLFSADTVFASGLEPITLEEELSVISDITQTKVQVFPSDSFSLRVDAELDAESFGSFLNELSGTQWQVLSPERPFQFELLVPAIEIYQSVKESIQIELEAQGFSSEQFSFGELPVSIEGRIDLTETGTENVISIVEQIETILA